MLVVILGKNIQRFQILINKLNPFTSNILVENPRQLLCKIYVENFAMRLKL
jgi:hypothetical protein